MSTRWTLAIAVSLLAWVTCLGSTLHAASHYETELLYFAGRYEEAEQVARDQVERGVWNELWPELLLRCLLTRGDYEPAAQVYEEGLRRYKDRIAYRLLGDTVYRFVNRPKDADEQLDEIIKLVQRRPWRYGTSRDQVTLGRFFVRQGEDARQILELVYDRVRKRNPDYSEVYIATAELALAKHDRELAVEQLRVAAKLQPSNPYVFYLQALAWREDDGAKAAEALNHALSLNPRHAPSLLLQIDQLIDAEQYAAAETLLEDVLAINPRDPMAWAHYAVVAHLQGHFKGETALRGVALEAWKRNHKVDHVIGRKLSQKYRFDAGAAYQRRALSSRPDFVPAKIQLANDLLRLGDESEGWQLVDEVQQQDEYHVVAFNLVTLKDQLDRFETLTSDSFVLRMDTTEAKIYGRQVIELLETAHAHLCPKYDVTLDGPVYVEIFPRQEDFAIRTFGLPGGSGYLGVCFGRLITANSPASQGRAPANWQSVLWHEFCHVVTLQKTQNRMPRWLSEGISVYEERQRDPSWGQRMTPAYRQMVMDGELTPVSDLSAAFLRPPSPQHLQFAYYEASLVVEYLIETHGLDVLRRILVDLSVGMPIEEAFQRYIGAKEQLDNDVDSYIRQRAESLAPGLEWDTSKLPKGASLDRIESLLRESPNNYWLLLAVARHNIEARDWKAALPDLEKILAEYPDESGEHGPARLLAQVYRELDDRSSERRVLQELARWDSSALDVFRRLMEIAEEEDDWMAVRENALRVVHVNPMISEAQQQLAQVAERLNDARLMIDALNALQVSDPVDPAGVFYRLAVAHERLGELRLAKRYVLMAMEEAPRFRNAQQLLLRLIERSGSPKMDSQSSTDRLPSTTLRPVSERGLQADGSIQNAQ